MSNNPQIYGSPVASGNTVASSWGNGVVNALNNIQGQNPLNTGLLNPGSVNIATLQGYSAIHPNGNFLYVSAYGGTGLDVHTLYADGTVSAASTAATLSYNCSGAPAIDQYGKWLYQASVGPSSGATMQAYTINANTGALTSVGSYAMGSQITSGLSAQVVHPSGAYVFATNPTAHTIYTWSIAYSTGALTQVGSALSTTGYNQIFCDPTGNYLYAVTGTNLVIYSINASTGGLTQISGSPYTLPAASKSIDFDPFGQWAFVLAESTSTVYSYAITQGTGALTLKQTFVSSNNGTPTNSMDAIAIHPSGNVLYFPGGVANGIACCSINLVSGALTQIGTVSVSGGAFGSLQTSPNGRFIYAIDFGSSYVDSWVSVPLSIGSLANTNNFGYGARAGTFHSGSGAFAPPSNANLSTGIISSLISSAGYAVPNGSIVCEPSGKWVYAAYSGAFKAYSYYGGQLVNIGTYTIGGSTFTGLAVINLQGGLFLYAATNGTIQAYTINTTTGLCTASGSAYTLTGAFNVTIDPFGRFLYVTTGSTGTIQAYTINQTTGVLSSVASYTLANAFQCVIDPTGNYLYCTSSASTGGGIQAYVINQSTGALTAGAFTPITNVTAGIAMDPFGRWLCVVVQTGSSSPGNQQSYSINQTTGAITNVNTLTSTFNASASNTIQYCTIDPTGNYLIVSYALSSYGSTQSTISINQSTGALTQGATSTYSANALGTGTPITFDPSGKFLFGGNGANNTLNCLNFQGVNFNSSQSNSFLRGDGNISNTLVNNASSDGCTVSTTNLLAAGTGWTSTGWTGSYAAGFTNGSGNTTALTNTLAPTSGNMYLVSVVVTGVTTGSCALSFGGNTQITSAFTSSATWNYYLVASSSGTLSITPTSTFNGTLAISVYLVTPSVASMSFASSNGTVQSEIRSTILSENTSMGYQALSYNYPTNTGGYGSANTVFGYQAHRYGVFSASNSAFGYQALYSFVGSTGSGGNFNTAIGYQALYGAGGLNSGVTPSCNTVVGGAAGYSLVSGGQNTFLGAYAGYGSTNVSGNLMIGYQAGYQGTTGTGQSLVGYQAGYHNTGSNNTALGYQAMIGSGSCTAYQNVNIGVSSGNYFNTAYNCTAVGYQSASSSNITSHNNCTFLGANTTANADGYTNSTVIGANASITASNQIVLGNSSITSTVCRYINVTGGINLNASDTVTTTQNGLFGTSTGPFINAASGSSVRIGIANTAIITASGSLLGSAQPLQIQSGPTYAVGAGTNVSTKTLVKIALAASGSASVITGLTGSYATMNFIDNQGNVVSYSLVAGTLTQNTTNATYSVTTSPSANKIGVNYAGGTITIYAGTGWTGFTWACDMIITN